jgi:2,4-dienoyl-CoA reductase-like NADH-dependent reductase (Old Yellow Enzyme family)
VTSFYSAHGAAIGIQLGHAGRKVGSAHQGHWDEELVGPSAMPFDTGWRVPRKLSTGEIADIVQAFAQAVRRALTAGF